jgi:hypothetical protein
MGRVAALAAAYHDRVIETGTGSSLLKSELHVPSRRPVRVRVRVSVPGRHTLALLPGLKLESSMIAHNNTIALLNSSTKAGNLRRGLVFPPRVWLAFEEVGYAIHGLAAQIAFALPSSKNLSTSISSIHTQHALLVYWT